MKKSLTLLFIALAFGAVGQIPTSSLVKEYLFDGGVLTNTVTPGNGDLTSAGSARVSADDLLERPDSAMVLNGDYLEGTDRASRDNLTVTFWIKTSTNSSTAQTIIEQYDASNFGPYGWYVELVDGKIRAVSTQSNGSTLGAPLTLESEVVADGHWHHIGFMATKEQQPGYISYGFRRRLYVDDELVDSGINYLGGQYAFLNQGDHTVNIGAPTNGFTGTIDNVRLYNAALFDAPRNELFMEFYNHFDRFYVDAGATGSGSGYSWENAMTDLSKATNLAYDKEIWVAKGTYRPHTSSRTESFVLAEGVELYGGFVGNETLREDRDWHANETVLSGDLLQNDDNELSQANASRAENSYRVVRINGNATILDGFTITGGHANHGSYSSGAAIYKEVAFKNLNIKNCRIKKNYALTAAAGVMCQFSINRATTVWLENIEFRNNMANYGTAFYGFTNYNGITSTVDVVGCLFADNVVHEDGYAASAFGMRAYAASSTLNLSMANCTFAGNQEKGAHSAMDDSKRGVVTLSAASSATATATIDNTIFWGNEDAAGNPVKAFANVFGDKLATISVANSIDEDAFSNLTPANLTNVQAVDPMFIAAGDYTLNCASPAVDAGDDSGLTLPAQDLKGDVRILNTLDMGAYEFTNILTEITAMARNVTIALDSMGNASIAADQLDDGSGTTCGVGFSLSLDVSSFDCASIGENTVTLTATEDGSGATATATATVTVIDTIGVAGEPESVVLYLDDSGQATLDPSVLLPEANDNCTAASSLIFTTSQTSFSKDDLGSHEITFSVSDAAQNSRTLTSSLEVLDTIPPTAVARSFSLRLGADGVATLVADSLNTTSSDNCDSLAFEVSTTHFSCEDIGEHEVMFYVTDGSGNKDSVETTVTVLTYFEEQSLSTSSGSFCVDGSSAATVTMSGSQSGVSYLLRRHSDSTVVDGPLVGDGSVIDFSTGALTETTDFHVFAKLPEVSGDAMTIGNGHGIVTIQNSPSLQLSGDFTLEAWVKPEQGIGFYHVIESYNGAGGFILRGTTSGKWQGYAMQSSGSYHIVTSNTSYQNDVWQHVAVTFDETSNELKLYVNGVLDATNANATIDQRGPTGVIWLGARGDDGNISARHQQDDVRIWNVARTDAQIADAKDYCLTGNEANLVAYYNYDDITFISGNSTITDRSANSNNGSLSSTVNGATTGENVQCGGTCGYQLEALVTIGDQEAPTALAKAYTLNLNTSGTATLVADSLDGGSSDNCTAGTDLAFSVNKAQFTCDDLGEQTVTLTVTDASGNATETQATVTVQNTNGLQAQAQDTTIYLSASGTATLTTSHIDNGSANTCLGQFTLSVSQSSFSCEDLGTNEVMLIADAGNGQRDTAYAVVTVRDTLAPEVVVQNQSLYLNDEGNATLDLATIDGGSTDNCSSTLTTTISQKVFACADVGEVEVTVTQEDAEGNAAEAIAVITVIDTISPVLLVKDVAIKLNEAGVATLTSADVDDGSVDNCSGLELTLSKSTFSEQDLGSQVVMVTGTDPSGNTASASVEVTVQPNKADQQIIAPTIPSRSYGDEPFLLAVEASSGLAVELSLVSGPVTLSNNEVTIVGAGEVTILASQPGDDTYLPAPDYTVSFNVGRAPLSVMANDVVKTYGGAVGTLELSYSGFVNGDEIADLLNPGVATCTVEENSAAGTYDIVVNGAESANYEFTYVNGTYTVQPATLQVIGGSYTKVYGQENPLMTLTYSGFVLGEGHEQLNAQPELSTTAGLSSDVGVYDVIVSGGASENYQFAYVNGTLTITQATATITLSNLEHMADGTSKTPTVETDPSGLSVVITYDGLSDAPSEAGSYEVLAVIDDRNYTGSASAQLIIEGLPLSSSSVGFSFYPNPVQEQIHFKTNKTVPLRIVDLSGSVLMEANSNAQLEVSGLLPGVYLLQFLQDGEWYVQRFVKE